MNNDTDFDLMDSIGIEDQAIMKITVPLPSGDSTVWRWTIASLSHPKGIAQKNRISRENLKKSAEQEQATVNRRKYKAEVQTPEEVDRSNVDFIVERLISWEPKYDNGVEVKLGGEPFPFSEENARKLLSLPKSEKLRNQAVEFILADDSFMRGSARN